jgi:hypothetical protein
MADVPASGGRLLIFAMGCPQSADRMGCRRNFAVLEPMFENRRDVTFGRTAARRVAAGCTALCVALVAGSVFAQQLPPASQEAPSALPSAAEETPNPGYRPGFLDTLNRWLGNSKSAIDSQIKQTQKTLGTIGTDATGAAQGAAGAAQDAAGAVVALPTARIVTGRQTCGGAPNGAPNCQPAIDALCRGKGFQTGKSLEVSSAHKCPTRVWLYGTAAEKAECPVETYVTRAICQ